MTLKDLLDSTDVKEAHDALVGMLTELLKLLKSNTVQIEQLGFPLKTTALSLMAYGHILKIEESDLNTKEVN